MASAAELLTKLGPSFRKLRPVLDAIIAEAAAARTVISTVVTGQNTLSEVTVEQALTESGAIASDSNFVTLDSATPLIAATIAAPAPGQDLTITQIDAGTAGHTVTLTAGTFDGTNEIATFNAEGETLVLRGLTATRFLIVLNSGEVALSTAG